MQESQYASHVFRIDRFVVPPASEDEFLRAIEETNKVFDGMEGCVQRHVFKQKSLPGESVFLTFVEWASEDAIQIARVAAAARHSEMNLNPRELFDRLQIKADLADFAPVAGFPA